MDRIFSVFGLGFGDEAKGSVVDALVRRYDRPASCSVVRLGGPQALHNVISPDGVRHGFSQFGSGLLAGAGSVLSSDMLVKPENLGREFGVLQQALGFDPGAASVISSECGVVTPGHQLLNRLRELALGAGRNGSCGQGVGLAVADRQLGHGLTVGEVLYRPELARKKLINLLISQWSVFSSDKRLKNLPRETLRVAEFTLELMLNDVSGQILEWQDLFSRFVIEPSTRAVDLALDHGPAVFECSQGALLHPVRGFRPHVTKTDPTGRLVAEMVGGRPVTRVGVLRAFAHRHGVGPLPTERSELDPWLQDSRNPENPWQGSFRVGWPDLVLMKYGLAVAGGADWLALTNLDRLSGLDRIYVCTSYEYVGPLKELGRFFVYRRLERCRAEVFGLKPFDGSERTARQRTNLMSRMRPLGQVAFDGWHQDISTCHRWADLPIAAQRLVLYFERELGAPIKIVSVSPTADGKIWR